MKKKLLAAAILAGAAHTAIAANGQPYYGLQGTYIDGDNLRNNKEGYGATLLLGLPVNQYLASELNVFGLRMDNSTQSFDKQWGAGLDLAIYPLTRSGRFAPFLLVGSGAQYEDRNGPERGYTFINAGGGFLADLTADGLVSLRVDAKRYRVHDNELIPGRDQLWDTRISAGLQVAFGPDPVIAPPPAPYVPPAPPADSDGDGVIDSIDQCPGTLPGLRVDSVGCPLPLPPPPMPPKDSDQDGVLDSSDACPGTPLGLKVDERGCAIKAAKIVLHDINFEFNSSTLTSGAKLSLDKVADGLRGQPTMSLLIEGHTDSVGADAYNLKLSKQRANSARAYLIESGIESSRIEATGLGETQPIASNKTKDGRAENRRVEFKVTRQ
ncbi:MAG: OmpA family protein [Stagnimonas sp.]|nr:OmpA family protein [Stagnimonas sp.]